ncbi:unnamed protein product [Echinostoma caproni]|uniref:Neur_chan_memb domain-containing protein n=1 Tax=Echinostoma caproni TaxID=27848 RepID=A0A183A664_9TREM|nr:unnamed protein product [Echinostoma caproni]
MIQALWNKLTPGPVSALILQDCTKNGTTSTGTYSCLLLTLPLQRLVSSYLVTTYIPEVLIVMVSWLGFWIDVRAVPARISLGLLTLLGLLTEPYPHGYHERPNDLTLFLSRKEQLLEQLMTVFLPGLSRIIADQVHAQTAGIVYADFVSA